MALIYVIYMDVLLFCRFVFEPNEQCGEDICSMFGVIPNRGTLAPNDKAAQVSFFFLFIIICIHLYYHKKKTRKKRQVNKTKLNYTS